MLTHSTIKKIDNIKQIVNFMTQHLEHVNERQCNVYSVAKTIASPPLGLRKKDFLQAIKNYDSMEAATYHLLFIHERIKFGKEVTKKADVEKYLGIKVEDEKKEETKGPDLFTNTEKVVSREELQEMVNEAVRKSVAEALKVVLNVLENPTTDDAQ